VWAQAAQHPPAATQQSLASPPPASRHTSPTVRFGAASGEPAALGPTASLSPPTASSSEAWGAGGSRGHRGAAGDVRGWQGSLTVRSTTRSGSESTAWPPPRRTPCSGACQGPEPPSCPGCRSAPTCGGQEWGEAARRELPTCSELSPLHPALRPPSAELQPLPTGTLAPLGTFCARARASPACLELQLLLGGAEDMLHLVLGDGLPLPRIFLEDVVPDDGNLAGEAAREEGVLTAGLGAPWHSGIRGRGCGQPWAGGARPPGRASGGSTRRGEGAGGRGLLWGTGRGWIRVPASIQVKQGKTFGLQSGARAQPGGPGSRTASPGISALGVPAAA